MFFKHFEMPDLGHSCFSMMIVSHPFAGSYE